MDKTKRGVQFLHLTRDISKICGGKREIECLNARFPLLNSEVDIFSTLTFYYTLYSLIKYFLGKEKKISFVTSKNKIVMRTINYIVNINYRTNKGDKLRPRSL